MNFLRPGSSVFKSEVKTDLPPLTWNFDNLKTVLIQFDVFDVKSWTVVFKQF